MLLEETSQSHEPLATLANARQDAFTLKCEFLSVIPLKRVIGNGYVLGKFDGKFEGENIQKYITFIPWILPKFLPLRTNEVQTKMNKVSMGVKCTHDIQRWQEIFIEALSKNVIKNMCSDRTFLWVKRVYVFCLCLIGWEQGTYTEKIGDKIIIITKKINGINSSVYIEWSSCSKEVKKKKKFLHRSVCLSLVLLCKEGFFFELPPLYTQVLAVYLLLRLALGTMAIHVLQVQEFEERKKSHNKFKT